MSLLLVALVVVAHLPLVTKAAVAVALVVIVPA
jgi:hypothetical protein